MSTGGSDSEPIWERTSKRFSNADFTYSPVQFNPADPPPTVSIRELYTDIQTNLFALKAGKQFLRWGSTEYFNPLDIVNIGRIDIDPSVPPEGNFFFNLNIPIGYLFSLEAIALVKEDTTSLFDLPVIGKVSFSFWQTSGFLFAYYQDGKKLTGGLDLILSIPFATGFNLSLYNQTLLRFETDKRYYTNQSGIFKAESLPDGLYPAYVAGLRTDLSFTTTRHLDGIRAAVEYYHDTENWTEERLGTYYDYLDTVKSNPPVLSALLSDYKALKNSRDYLYASMSFVSPFIRDLQLDSAAIVNLSDRSFVLMPHASYLFNNGNTETGARAFINFGGDRTEFGNSVYTYRLELYAQTSF